MAAARALPERLKASLLTLGILVALVILPYLFWHGAWFGRPLSDPELEEYLADQEKPRRIQHALAQLAERIEKDEPGIERWYQTVSALVDHPATPVRVMLAWTLGHDPRSESFHTTLRHLMEDESVLVRRNAALSLVRFGDASGLAELRSMLKAHTVPAEHLGPVRYLVELEELVEPGAPLFEPADGEGEPVRAVLGGKIHRFLVPAGAVARPGEPAVEIFPNPGHVWEALRALALVGGTEELPLVEAILEDPSTDQTVRNQAVLTRTAIKEREERPDPSSLAEPSP